MGGSRYSDDVFRARVDNHKRTGTDYYTHDADVRSGRTAAGANPKLDPSKPNKAGKIVRECLDSTGTPNSRAVAVIFDNTGSMANNPRLFVKNLDKLMAALVKKGYLPDPHILFGCYADATCDRVPLQLGQFESGNEMDEALSLMYLESGGGGHIYESAELAIFFMARYTDLDCVKKRGQKGFMFLIGDELPRETVSRSQVKQAIGVDIEADIPLATILEEARQKFEVIWVMPSGASHTNNPDVVDPLQKMFGQHFIRLENPDDICELLATTIGVFEGYDVNDIASDLKDIGLDKGAIDRTTMAVTKLSASKAVTKGAKVEGDLVPSGVADGGQRL